MISLFNFALWFNGNEGSHKPRNMKIKLFTIPNFLTLGNLLCGSLAVMFLNSLNVTESKDILSYLLILLFVSLLFDLLDGMVARALKINSAIGLQLDSLADMVSFGLVPGFMMFNLLSGYTTPLNEGDFVSSKVQIDFVAYFGFFITLFSALRLAKFNIDTEQATYFKGLATPANTILIFSLYWIYVQKGKILSPEIDLYFLIGITILSCYLLISNLPLFSFKFKGFSWKENHFKYIFMVVSLILVIGFQMSAVPFIIILYIIISIIFRKKIEHA